jgi:hypothetical protein
MRQEMSRYGQGSRRHDSPVIIMIDAMGQAGAATTMIRLSSLWLPCTNSE